MYFCQPTLEAANVRLETVGGPHLDGEEVVVVLLELLAGRVLREGQLGGSSKLWIDRGVRE